MDNELTATLKEIKEEVEPRSSAQSKFETIREKHGVERAVSAFADDVRRETTWNSTTDRVRSSLVFLLNQDSVSENDLATLREQLLRETSRLADKVASKTTSHAERKAFADAQRTFMDLALDGPWS